MSLQPRNAWILFCCSIVLALGGLPQPTASLPIPIAPARAFAREQPAAQRYRVTRVSTRQQRGAINATGAAIETVGPDYVELLATPEQRRQIAALGFVAELVAQPSAMQPVDPAYHTYAQMLAEIEAVAAAHPAIVQLFSIGRSYEGRELWAAKLSRNVAIDEDEPEALFVGQYHAREHLTLEMMLYILHMLADNDRVAGQERITSLLDSREIYLVFNLNPDGSEYDTASGFYQNWRKNRQPNLGGGFGVDLNRNHSYLWGCCDGSSNSSFDLVYRGSAPASELEVRAMEAFVNSRVVGWAQQISVAISFHTYSELVLWPYGHTYEDVPSDMRADDQAVFVALGQAMAASNGYTAMQASDLYPIDGDFTDWAYGFHHIFAFTFEMYPPFFGSEGFYPPGSVIARETERNRAALLYLLEQAGCPYAVVGKQLSRCANGRIHPPLRTWAPLVR